MRVLKLFSLVKVVLFLSIYNLNGQVTPESPSMAVGDDNSMVFVTGDPGSGLLGTDNGVSYYLTWDGTYLYFGFDGGNTDWWSDLYNAGIDFINDEGCSADVYGVTSNGNVFDYYVVWENNGEMYGGGGDNLRLYENNATNNGWNLIHNVDPANDNTEGRIKYGSNPDEVRFRIAWSLLGITPGSNQPIAFTFWINDFNGTNVYSSFPTDNPTGNPVTMTHKLVFNSTGNAVDPSTSGSVELMAFVLPVELISFDATAKGESVELDWSTAAEMNNSHFTIEHAIDGKEFYAIGHVEGAGESTELLRYAYTHEQPAVGTNYYRLAQYDYDGTVSYSDIEMVRIGSESTSVQVFPNPSKDQITIQIDEPVFTGSIQIYDVHGSLVAQQGSRSNTTFDMNTETWDVGIYQLVICPDRGDCITKTIIKQ